MAMRHSPAAEWYQFTRLSEAGLTTPKAAIHSHAYNRTIMMPSRRRMSTARVPFRHLLGLTER